MQTYMQLAVESCILEYSLAVSSLAAQFHTLSCCSALPCHIPLTRHILKPGGERVINILLKRAPEDYRSRHPRILAALYIGYPDPERPVPARRKEPILCWSEGASAEHELQGWPFFVLCPSTTAVVRAERYSCIALQYVACRWEENSQHVIIMSADHRRRSVCLGTT